MTNPDHHLAKRVLERIDAEHLSPRPRWEFIFKDYFFWSLGALAVALGALATSAMIFEVANVDWRFAPVTHDSLFSFFLDVAPFLWVGALAVFILIGYVNVRRTSRGYRYPLSVIALGAVLTSLTLGSALYATGLGNVVEDVVGDHAPFHHPILEEQYSWWIAPEKGLLGGEVVSAAPGVTTFVIRDFNDVSWQIDGSDLRGPDLTTVARGGIVRVVGVPTTATSSVFHACFVLPWEFYGGPRNQLPPPLAVVAPTSERNMLVERSDLCKGIRPYAQLRDIDRDGF